MALARCRSSDARRPVFCWRRARAGRFNGVSGASRYGEVPLGSLWKLFVFVYPSDTDTPMPDYRCLGHDREELYCCQPGGAIARAAALAQSCPHSSRRKD
jgi:uncharacterized protein YfaQ (DUF2300 family)